MGPQIEWGPIFRTFNFHSFKNMLILNIGEWKNDIGCKTSPILKLILKAYIMITGTHLLTTLLK